MMDQVVMLSQLSSGHALLRLCPRLVEFPTPAIAIAVVGRLTTAIAVVVLTNLSIVIDINGEIVLPVTVFRTSQCKLYIITSILHNLRQSHSLRLKPDSNIIYETMHFKYNIIFIVKA